MLAVTVTSRADPMSADAEQIVDVPEDHDAVLQLCNPSPVVGVKSLDRKFSPLTVTSPPPLAAVLSVHTKLTAGAEGNIRL